VVAVILAAFGVGAVAPIAAWLLFDAVLPMIPLVPTVAVASCAALLSRRRLRVLVVILVVAVGYARARSGVVTTASHLAACEALSTSADGEVSLRARVDDISRVFADSPSIIVTVLDSATTSMGSTSADLPSLKGARLLVYPMDAEPGEGLVEGDVVDMHGNLAPVRGPKFFGGPSPRSIYLPQRVVGFVSDGHVVVTDRGSGFLTGLRRAVSLCRVRIAGSLKAHLPQAEAGIVMAAFLGMSGTLPDNVDDAVRRAGISHLLSVSGMHIGMIAAAVVLLMRALINDPRKARLCGLPILLLYAMLAGMRVSVMRALIMFGLASMSAAGSLGWSSRRITEFAALVLLLIDPLQVAQVSFQLSFGATYGIVVVASYGGAAAGVQSMGQSENRVRGWLKSTTIVFMGAQIGVTPFLLFHFRSLPLAGGVATVMSTPFLVLGTVLSLVGVGLHALGVRLLAIPCTFLGRWLLRGLVSGALFIGQLRWASVEFSALWSHTLACITASCCVLALSVRRDSLARVARVGRRSLLAAGLVSCAALLAAGVLQWVSLSRFELYFLSVGQGDCAVCISPGGRTVVIDGGPVFKGDGYRYDAGESVLLPFLGWRGIGHIDVFILTHFHSDHYGGLPALVRKGMVSVVCSTDPDRLRALLESELELDSRADRTSASTAAMPVLVKLGVGDRITVGDAVSIDVIWPPDRLGGGDVHDENSLSIAALVRYGRFNALFTGDIGSDQETKIIQGLRNDALSALSAVGDGEPLLSSRLEVLKVAHHGSQHSSSYVFLRSLSPWMSIISTGTNAHGHPSGAVLKRLDQHSQVVSRTDEDGSVRICSDGVYFSAVTSHGRLVARRVELW
jgi:competence protein ComEC